MHTALKINTPEIPTHLQLLKPTEQPSVRPDLPLIGDPVYVTQATWNSIVWNFQQAAPQSKTPLFPTPLSILADRDKTFLDAAKWAFQHTEDFLQWCYQTASKKETPNHVFKSGPPAYHQTAECPRLHADYENIGVPAQINVRGDVAITAFKAWANANKQLFIQNQELFKLKICTEFKINPNELLLVIYENSGNLLLGNENLDEINRLIQKLIHEAEDFRNASEKNQRILNQYQRYSGLGSTATRLHSNRTGYSEAEVKQVLHYFRGRFQKPLNRLLLAYFRVRYNPELAFTGNLLDQLGLTPCRHCHTPNHSLRRFPCPA